MHARLSDQDIRARYHGIIRRMDAPLLTRLTQIDYDRDMAMIGFAPTDDVPVGVVRMHGDPENVQAEFAILVRSDWKGRGLGIAMLGRLIAVARGRNLKRLMGIVQPDNGPMLGLAHKYGFRIVARNADGVTVMLDL